jgi:addiction module HigA family antidote
MSDPRVPGTRSAAGATAGGDRRHPHPGHVLLHQFLKPRSQNHHDLERRTALAPALLMRLIEGEAAVTPHVANELARFFGNTSHFWRRLQVPSRPDPQGDAVLRRLAGLPSPRPGPGGRPRGSGPIQRRQRAHAARGRTGAPRSSSAVVIAPGPAGGGRRRKVEDSRALTARKFTRVNFCRAGSLRLEIIPGKVRSGSGSPGRGSPG